MQVYLPSLLLHHIQTICFLKAQVKDRKRIALIKADNGSDWNLLNIVNEIYFCRLWRDSGLDILGIVSYAAKYSAYNNIEQTWSPMSRQLSSVVLLSGLEGEEEPPCKQADLTNNERVAKEVKCRYYNNLHFDLTLLLVVYFASKLK